MKITIEELKTMIREQVEEAKVKDAEAQVRAFVDSLQRMLDAGEIHKLSTDDLDAIKPALRSLKGKVAADKRSPDDRKIAADKAAATRAIKQAELKADTDRFVAGMQKKKDALYARMNRGLLPLAVTGYGGTPSAKYYTPDGDMIMGPDGFSIPKFKLKPQFVRMKLDPSEFKDILNGAEPV